jgi:hypothetical protein
MSGKRNGFKVRLIFFFLILDMGELEEKKKLVLKIVISMEKVFNPLEFFYT